MAAFLRRVDLLLEDLGRARGDFWGTQLPVVDTFLSNASDKLQHKVEQRLAAARARLAERISEEGEADVNALKHASKSCRITRDQEFHPCPVCESHGIATGEHTVDWMLGHMAKEAGQDPAHPWGCRGSPAALALAARQSCRRERCGRC